VIEISAYQPVWPQRFGKEAAQLQAGLGPVALRIEHVGSTAVPGLAAKPVIDIQVSVASLLPHGRYVEVMAGLGYTHVAFGDFDLVYPFFHKSAQWPSTHHVHLCEAGGELERKHLMFRDHLRAHPQVAAQYEALKRVLARSHDADTPQAMEAYSLAKAEFIGQVLRAAQALAMPAA
jgi:GrpB-like predicted nucleotidyltransferase (UPF0157 family)